MGKIVLARVDERLIHGQVLYKWFKKVNFDYIYLVDDEVEGNEFLSAIYNSVAQRCALNLKILKLSDAIMEWKIDQFGKHNVILLFKDINTAYDAYMRGIEFPILNVGGLTYKDNYIDIIDDIMLSIDDAAKLRILADKYNVYVYFRALPENEKLNLAECTNI